jgi:hypothetical protein
MRVNVLGDAAQRDTENRCNEEPQRNQNGHKQSGRNRSQRGKQDCCQTQKYN